MHLSEKYSIVFVHEVDLYISIAAYVFCPRHMHILGRLTQWAGTPVRYRYIVQRLPTVSSLYCFGVTVTGSKCIIVVNAPLKAAKQQEQ